MSEQRLKYTELSPDGVKAMRGVEHHLNTGTGLDAVLLELVRLRASLLNGCEFCIGMHAHELEKHHEPESRVSAVAGWRESEAFTERERAALAWTEAVTNVQDGHVSDEAFAAVREHFQDKELVDLTLAIASINAWNRMAIAFRPQWDAAKAKNASEGGGRESQLPNAGPFDKLRAGSGARDASPDVESAVSDDEGEVAVDGK